jgi:ribose transport system substrate-binding protein
MFQVRKFATVASVASVVLALTATVFATGAVTASAVTKASGPTSSAKALSTASCVSTAKERVAAFEKPIVFKAPGPSFSVAKDKGKKLWVIEEVSSLPVAVNLNDGIAAAAKAAGIKVTFFNGENTPATEAQGVSEAVAQHAAAIDLEGVEPENVSAALKGAYAAKIPVVDDWNTDPNAPLDGEYAHVTFQYTLGGRELADYVLAETGCKADVVAVNTPGLTSVNDASSGTVAEFKSLCPTCKVTVDNVLLANLATGVGSSVVNDIQADSSINWVICPFDAAADLVVPALQSAGIKNVQVAGHDGSAPDIAFVRAGNIQTEDMTIGPPTLQGWITVDQVLRAMEKLPPSKQDVIPQQILTSANITKSGNLFPKFGNFALDFETSWGLKK